MNLVKLSGIVILALGIGRHSCHAATPPFVTASFDSHRVGLAVGKFEPHGGSAVFVSPDGVAVTAYHVVAQCIARLRRNVETGKQFGADGSYTGNNEGLLCDGLYLRVPLDCETMGPPEAVYVLGVPAVREARVFALTFQDGGSEPPKADFAIVRIARRVQHYLPLGQEVPVANARIWVAGYPLFNDSDRVIDSAARQQLELSHFLFRARQVLFGILAEAAQNPDQASRSAKGYAMLYANRSHATPGLIDLTAGNELDDIEAIAQGPESAKRVLAKRLMELAGELTQEAAPEDTDPDYATFLISRSEELRELANRAHGPAVQEVMTRVQHVYERVASDVKWDLERKDVATAETWCGLRVFSGYITKVDSWKFEGAAAVAPGMSGGPVVNERGKVVGLAIQRRRLTLGYYPQNLLAARIDFLRSRFGSLLGANGFPSAPQRNP